jgi:hypothetical protein
MVPKDGGSKGKYTIKSLILTTLSAKGRCAFSGACNVGVRLVNWIICDVSNMIWLKKFDKASVGCLGSKKYAGAVLGPRDHST